MVMIFNPGWRTKAAQKAGKEDGEKGIPALDVMEVSPYEEIIRNSCEQPIREHEGDFQRSESEFRQLFKSARDDYQRAKALFEKKHDELSRPVIKHIPMWGYVLSLIAIIVVELPINQAALNILGEAPILTFSLALILGVVFMIVAHLIGMTMRHKGFHAESFLAIVVVIGIIVGLAYIRVKFFMNPEEGEILSNAMKDIDTRALAALFALMNILFLLVAVWLSYLSHDEDEHYAQMHKDYLKKRKAALAIAQKRAERHAAYKTDAKDRIEMAHGLISEYRRHNLLSRQSRVVPHVWGEWPPERLLDIENFNFELDDNEVG